MRLLSCSNPQRVYNKYLGDYVTVPCGRCAICKNRRAAKYTNLLERERLQHRYCFFVTLTYDEVCIPKVQPVIFYEDGTDVRDMVFHCSRERDCERMVFDDFFPPDQPDKYDMYDVEYFVKLMKYGGMNYASKTDAQLFLKRLNKYCHDKVTNQFKNFRYFLVSEYGCTTFRGHLHGIFYCDSERLAERFSECVSSCWQFGITDCQFVEANACAYVAQYINKSSDLPYVYQHSAICPFFLCSRRPFIGTFSDSPEDDREVVVQSSVTEVLFGKPNTNKFDVVPLQPSRQNRLFPKCPRYGTVSDYVRVQLYTACERFGYRDFRGFLKSVFYYVTSGVQEEFAEFLRGILGFCGVNDVKFYVNHMYTLFDEYSFNFLRRVYYTSKRFARQACQFGLTFLAYIQKIVDYYNKKEIYLLKEQYEYQMELSKTDCDSICLMYPDFMRSNGFTIMEGIDAIGSVVGRSQVDDADYFAFSNKREHFKNAYLDSLSLKESSIFLFNLIKDFLYGKKCDEIIEAFASPCET